MNKNNNIVVLTDLNYLLTLATVKYDEIYGYSPREDMEIEVVIAREWDKLDVIEDEDIYQAVKDKLNTDRIYINEIDVKHIIDGKEYVAKIDCTKFR